MRLLNLITLIALGAYAAAADHAAINTTCPVSGKPVDPAVKTTPYNPKTDQAAKANPGTAYAVGFCCPKCEATYVKPPMRSASAVRNAKPLT
jgi:hypothetical protein